MLHREEAGRMGQVIQTRFIGFYSHSAVHLEDASVDIIMLDCPH